MAKEGSTNGGFAVLITRVAASWILLGAFMKLFLGTPEDLPAIVKNLPPDVGLTFKVAIAGELAVGFLGLLKPRWSWLLVLTLLLVFDVALITQMNAGEASCGCFGSEVTVPPVVVLGVDSLLILLILVSRPWAALGRDGIHALALVMLLLLAVPLPWLLDREKGDPPIGKKLVILEVEKGFVGQKLADTKFGQALDLDNLPSEGVWVVYRDSCEVCADLLWHMSLEEQHGDRPIVLLRLQPTEDEEGDAQVHALPQGGHVHPVELSADVEWILTPPVLFVTKDGCVIHADAQPTPESHEKSLNPEIPESCGIVSPGG